MTNNKNTKSFCYRFSPLSFSTLKNDKYDIINSVVQERERVWLHFERPSKQLQNYLAKALQLKSQSREVLFAEEQRPRCVKIDNGYLLIVQAIQPSQLESDEAPPSLRFYITNDRLISVATGKVDAINDVHSELENASSLDSASCLANILEYLVWYIEETTYKLDEMLDKIEANISYTEVATQEISNARQHIVIFRRYILAQRDAITMLTNKIELLAENSVSVFKEISDATVRQAEMLEMLRERASIIQDNINNQIGELANRRMYVLTIIMLIFTPAFFVMGLFSMYVPIPFMNDKLTWWVVLFFIIISSGFLLYIFKKKKWL